MIQCDTVRIYVCVLRSKLCAPYQINRMIFIALNATDKDNRGSEAVRHLRKDPVKTIPKSDIAPGIYSPGVFFSVKNIFCWQFSCVYQHTRLVDIGAENLTALDANMRAMRLL